MQTPLLGLLLALGPQGADVESEALTLGRSASQVEVIGNRAVPTTVYRYVLAREVVPLTEAYAERAQSELKAFLKSAGFPFAQVEARVVNGRVRVFVDEGTIERVVFPGQSGLTSALAGVLFNLEEDVFNTYRVRRELKNLEDRLGVEVEGFQMVATATGAITRFQLRQLEGFAEAVQLPPVGRYVLSIELANELMSPGWSLGLSSTGPDGLIVEGGYRWASVFQSDDRLELTGGVGIRFDEIFGGEGAPILSRGQLGIDWYSHELFAHVRLLTSVHGAYLNRQRPDLGETSYDLIQPEAAAGLFWRADEASEASLTLGVDYRYLLDGDLSDTEVQPTTTGFPRAFVKLEGQFVPFPIGSNYRLDRRLTFNGYIRTYLGQTPYVDLRLTVEKGWPVGRYNDLRLEARGVGLFGEFGLVDEYRVSDLFRGLYGDQLYTSRAATASAEFFLSLEREFLRTSVFVDGLVYRGSPFTQGPPPVEPGVAGGVGFHALVFSAFQASIYGVVGVIRGQSLDGGLNLSLSRLF